MRRTRNVKCCCGLLALLVTLIIGVPVPFAFFVSSLSIVVMGGYDPSFMIPYGMNKGELIILCAIPMFILASGIMEHFKIGDRLVGFIQMFVGKVKGGLGVVMVVACAIFGAISGSGSGNATVSCIGSIMLPRMRKGGLSGRPQRSADRQCRRAGSADPAKPADGHVCLGRGFVYSILLPGNRCSRHSAGYSVQYHQSDHAAQQSGYSSDRKCR